MVTARICENWDMKLPDMNGNEWFLNWVLRDPNQVSHHLTAGWMAWRALSLTYAADGASSAREYFGGIGAQSLMIEDLFDPDDHDVMDRAPAAVKHLLSVLPVAQVYEADSYDPKNTEQADLVGLDFGDLTAWRTRPGEKHYDLLDRVFTLEPAGVVLTDVAGPRLHLHKSRYESLLGKGTCIDYPTYLGALADRIEDLWGYSLVAGFWHRWSTVMALVPTGAAPRGVFVPTPESPVGLVLL